MHKRRHQTQSGFTLMELLLVIAVLAVVAAVGAPQFFRSSIGLADEARLNGLKSNYALIMQACKARLEHERTNPSVTSPLKDASSGDYNDSGSRVRLLVDNGFLPKTAVTWETRTGKAGTLVVVSVSPSNKLPPFLQPFSAFQVEAINPEVGKTVNITSVLDAQAVAGTPVPDTWSEIWADLH